MSDNLPLMSSLPSITSDHDELLDGRSADAVESMPTFLPPSVNSEGISESSAADVSTTDVYLSRAVETSDSTSQAPLEPHVTKADSDMWQRAPNFQQKGLIPSPHTPLQVMHTAKRKYKVGKKREEFKQRQLKDILNKLTPQNFAILIKQVKVVNIDNARTLAGFVSQIFDKALMDPTFCEIYANFCLHLAGELPGFEEDNERITFKRLLLNKCQEEFERGEKEQEEANKADEDGEIKQSPEEREEKRLKARRRMLGNIRLIGELYKKRMLTERVIHECLKKLLGQYQNPDEEDVEALCILMSTVGEMIDHPKAKDHMDAYFDRMTMLSNNMKLSSRIRIMLKDSIDLRRNKWQHWRKVEGPKNIDDGHRDAAEERHLQASRMEMDRLKEEVATKEREIMILWILLSISWSLLLIKIF